jgi:hypothetical protein
MAILPNRRDHEGVLHMTEAQVWAMMGVFTALFLGTLTIVSTLFVHVVRSEVRRLDDKIDLRFTSIENDLQALYRHIFGPDGR